MSTNDPATKKDINSLRTELKTDIKDLKSEIKFIRKEILQVEERVENIEDTQKQLLMKVDKIQNTMDKFLGVVDDLRTDNTVGTHHTRELQITVEDHEKRLKHIEPTKHAA